MKEDVIKSLYQIPPELKDMIPGYLGRRDQDLLQLNAALVKVDFESISQIAHKLKGNGASYGFKYLTQIGIHLMRACENRNQLEVAQLISDFQAEIEKIKFDIL